MTISVALCPHFAHLVHEPSPAFNIAIIYSHVFLFAVLYSHIFNHIFNFYCVKHRILIFYLQKYACVCVLYNSIMNVIYIMNTVFCFFLHIIIIYVWNIKKNNLFVFFFLQMTSRYYLRSSLRHWEFNDINHVAYLFYYVASIASITQRTHS